MQLHCKSRDRDSTHFVLACLACVHEQPIDGYVQPQAKAWSVYPFLKDVAPFLYFYWQHNFCFFRAATPEFLFLLWFVLSIWVGWNITI